MITALHKKGSVKLPKNFCPVQVLMGISTIFEGNIEPQFTRWIMHFIPDVQFGFIPGCGTDEYGAAVVFVIQSCLEKKGADNKRGEGILISRMWLELLTVVGGSS